MSAFGERLCRLREEAGMTQPELAAKARVGTRTIGRMEQGQRVGHHGVTVRRVAEALGLSGTDQAEFIALAAGQEVRTAPKGPPVADPVRSAEPRRPDLPSHLRVAADDLAVAVEVWCQGELDHQRVQDPVLAPVSWRVVSGYVGDHEAGRFAPEEHSGTLADDNDELTDLYRELQKGKLVILGGAGSGKSVLAMRLLPLLMGSQKGLTAIPVIVGLAAWNPFDEDFETWLSGRLIRDYPGLSAESGVGGLTIARALVGKGAVLPILDGFDEIAVGLRHRALQELSTTRLPFLLTSRPIEYTAAVAAGGPLEDGTVVQLGALTDDDIAAYFGVERRAGVDDDGSADPLAVAWAPVIDRFGQDAQGRAVADALRTRLMLSLARTGYGDGRDPAVLLDQDRFPDSAHIEDHLLASFVPTVYAEDQRGGAGRRTGDWEAAKVRQWLGYLAQHAQRHNLAIAWWELGASISLAARAAIVGFAMMLVQIGIGVVMTALSVVIPGQSKFDQLARTSLHDVLGAELPQELAAAMVVAIGYVVLHRVRGLAPRPTRVRPGSRRRGRGQLGRHAKRTVAAALGGLVFGACLGVVQAFVGHSGDGTAPAPGVIVADLAFWGATWAVALGAAVAIISLLERPADLDAAATPTTLLHADRETVLTQMAIGGIVVGLVTGLGILIIGPAAFATVEWVAPALFDGIHLTTVWSWQAALYTGLVNCVICGLVFLLVATAWGQWLLLARFWLPLTGRLPWRLTAFLDDAYQRGVLRHPGPVYQFRHDRLCAHLAAAEVAAPPSGDRAERFVTGTSG